jgi:ribosome-associated protein
LPIPKVKKPRPAPPRKTAAKNSPASKDPAAPRRKKAASAAPVAPPPSDAWLACARAAEDKKATAVRALDLRGSQTSFADFLIICSAGNQKQAQAVVDEIERVMKLRGDPPISVEGYNNAEWILMDFGDLVVNVFTESARSYYDLDRLFRDAPTLPIPRAALAAKGGVG